MNGEEGSTRVPSVRPMRERPLMHSAAAVTVRHVDCVMEASSEEDTAMMRPLGMSNELCPAVALLPMKGARECISAAPDGSSW